MCESVAPHNTKTTGRLGDSVVKTHTGQPIKNAFIKNLQTNNLTIFKRQHKIKMERVYFINKYTLIGIINVVYRYIYIYIYICYR